MAMGRSRVTACRLQIDFKEMIPIKLRDYLRLHPHDGVELLTEFGYYTLTKEEIKTQLRRQGQVRSVTGRPLAFSELLEQEVLDVTGGETPLVYTARFPREQEQFNLQMGGL